MRTGARRKCLGRRSLAANQHRYQDRIRSQFVGAVTLLAAVWGVCESSVSRLSERFDQQDRELERIGRRLDWIESTTAEGFAKRTTVWIALIPVSSGWKRRSRRSSHCRLSARCEPDAAANLGDYT